MPQAFWRALEHMGVQPAAVLRQARLSDTLHQSGGLVTTVQLFAIWKAIEELTADPGFGLKLVEVTETAGFPLFLAAGFEADFRECLTRIFGFKRLGGAERFHFEERDSEFSVFKEWPYAVEPEPPISIDVTFAFIVELGRRGTRQHLSPLRIDFARSGPETEVHRTYFACPIRYGAPRDMIVLRSADLDRPFPNHNSEILDMLTPAMTTALSEGQGFSTVRDQVKLVLKKVLASGRPDVARVARDLGMSERTLQRRITEEGVTFRTLLREARHELGLQLLSNRSIEVEQVSFLLGYQDSSSFYRAFREWEGMTPRRWRAHKSDPTQDRTGRTLPH